MVSIVIPVYNAGHTVLRAVNSCLNQTFHDIEIIAINDGSTDQTLKCLQDIRDTRLRITNTSHQGVAEAFNVGIRAANGKYIARMDADDEMFPDRIEKQVNFLDQHPETGVVSSLVEYGGDRKVQEGYALHVDWLNALLTPGQIALNRFVDSPVCNPSVMFRRELPEQFCGALTGDFPEDYEMWLRWMDKGVLFGKVPEVLLRWNDFPTRITRNDDRYSAEAFERIKAEYLLKFILQNNAVQRPIYICGTGRITRRRSDELIRVIKQQSPALRIGGYLEIDASKTGATYNNVPVLHIDSLPDHSDAYVINYVSVRGARENLRKLFQQRGFAEGSDYIMAG